MYGPKEYSCNDDGDHLRCALWILYRILVTRCTRTTRATVERWRRGGSDTVRRRTFKGADGERGTEAVAAAAAAHARCRCVYRAAGPLPAASVGGDTRPHRQPAIGATRGRLIFYRRSSYQKSWSLSILRICSHARAVHNTTYLCIYIHGIILCIHDGYTVWPLLLLMLLAAAAVSAAVVASAVAAAVGLCAANMRAYIRDTSPRYIRTKYCL